MSLQNAYKGYEYQDLLSAFHIISLFASEESASIKIDQKEIDNDKFDDLTIITKNSIVKRQVKYSDGKALEKADLSSNRCDIAIDILFKSWKELNKDRNVDIRLCLAWEFIEDSEDLVFLIKKDMQNHYKSDEVKFLQIDIERIWPSGESPIKTWKRLKSKEKQIDRNEFDNFLKEFVVEVNLPKASIDFANPGQLELLVIRRLQYFGIGKFPNEKKSVVDVAMHLMHVIKGARANGKVIELSKLVYHLGLKKSYGNIQQEFVIDKEINVITSSKYREFKEFLFKNDKVVLLGEPGSGKSWFIQNMISFLNEQDIKVVRHYCYSGIGDIHEKERITVEIFMANLINDIIKEFPYLENYKPSKYGVDFIELQTLIHQIPQETVVIVDGLDHIGRIYGLHQNIMKEFDTKIVELISKIDFPINVKVVLASQPVNEVLELCKTSFKEYTLNPWIIEEVKVLMKKNMLSDIRLNNDTFLSDILLLKCSGNPLYVTYLINELSEYRQTMITLELVESFPPYSKNLENYYSFLMAKLIENQMVPQILAGSPFALTIPELIEITHQGEYVNQSIILMRSILTYNSFTGGYKIYHESFRRYVLGVLKKNGVRVEDAIFLHLIEWLKARGFYNDQKAYLNLLSLLYESKRNHEILDFCNKEFIIDSIFYGNGISSIKHNFRILMKAACVVQDYGKVIICTELSDMIYSFEYSFDENSQYYYLGLGLLNGFENLKGILTYEGKAVLNYKEGLRVCFLCSQNNVMPDWDMYINLIDESDNSGRREHLEIFKYYICACLDIDICLENTLSNISGEDVNDYREVVMNEYSRRGLIKELKESINRLKDNEHWTNSLCVFLGEVNIDEYYLEEALAILKHSEIHSDKTIAALEYYYKNIEWIISSNLDKLAEFVNSIENKNWYYNWLIYIYRINAFFVQNKECEFSDDTGFIEAYTWLTKDMEVFKGKPRTCDLYKCESLIYDSIKQPLKYITKESLYRTVLGIIEEMSNSTMTTLTGSTGGPLPTYKLFDLFLEIINEHNSGVISDIFENRIDDEDKHRFYSYLADYNLKFAIILSKGEKTNEAKVRFKRGVEYMLSYSFRKDRTLSRLIDSVESIYQIDNEVGLNCILRLKPLADAVVDHTDGKSTKHYPREWFEVLAKVDRDIALTHLSCELMKYSNYWVIEDCFDNILKLINNEVEPVVENILFKTIQNNTSSYTIMSYLHNIHTLVSNNEIDLARLSIRELLNRFPNGVKKDIYDKVKKLCMQINFDIEIRIKPEVEPDRDYGRYSGETIKYDKPVRNDSFCDMLYDDVFEYIITYGIRESEMQGLYYYILSIQELTAESKLFISNLVKHIYERREDDESRIRLLNVIGNLSMKPIIMAFIYITMYLNHRDGWYRKLTQTDFFEKAIKFDKEVAEQCFFEYFHNSFHEVEYSLSVGDEIINALKTIGFDGKLIIQYWESLFEIINFRLSGQHEYNQKEIIALSEEFSSKEKVMFLLLTRFKYGEANRYKWILSGLDRLFQNTEHRLIFIKPFKRYLKNRNEFTDYSLIIMLWLIRKWFPKEELHRTNLIGSLLEIYPTTNKVINFLILKISEKKNNRIYIRYNQDCKRLDESTEFLLNSLESIDNRIDELAEKGVNISKIATNYGEEISERAVRERLSDLFFVNAYNALIPNVYYYDLLMKHMGNEVDLFVNQFAGSPLINEIEEELYKIIIDDLDYIISNCRSLHSRPSGLQLPVDVENSIEEVKPQEWTTLAYQERWYRKRERHKSSFAESSELAVIISGVGFTNDDDIVPLLKLNGDYRIFDENYEIGLNNKLSYVPIIAVSDIKVIPYDDPFLTFRPYEYLGIRGDVLNALGVVVKDNGEGIVGVDNTGEVVLKYSRWEVCFDDYEADTYSIPYLCGAELKAKSSLVEKICKLYNVEPRRYTIKLC